MLPSITDLFYIVDQISQRQIWIELPDNLPRQRPVLIYMLDCR